VVFALALQPAVTAGSILMTIDSPFVCLWTWALVAAHRALFHDSMWAWSATGLLVGLGILAKYTMGLWLVSLGLFLLFTPTVRAILIRRGFWLMVGIAFVSCLPILWWNSQNGWVTFRHVAGQAGVATTERGSAIRWLGPLEYVGGQFALLLGFGFVAWLCAMFQFRPTRQSDPAIRYLWWMSAPTFVLFGVVSLRSSGQLNWPIAAYLSGTALAAAWLHRAMQSTNPLTRRATRIGAAMTCVVGIALSIILLETRLARPTLAASAKQLRLAKENITGKMTPDDPFFIRSVDPTCRLRGWKHLGDEIDVVRAEVGYQNGCEPIIAGSNWSIIGEIGFYCHGHPRVFSIGPYFGDRHSQYDMWRPNPVSDAQVFVGRTFIVVGADERSLLALFAHVNLAKDVVYHEDGLPVAGWKIWVCREFRGLPLDRAAIGNY
jgi:hypothetical protein